MSCQNDSEDVMILTAIGNPNIDINVKIDDTHLLDKYALSYDGHRHCSIEFVEKLKNEIEQLNYEVNQSPGGCAQNTLRVFQWLHNSKFNSVMIGSVGVDEEAGILKKEMNNQGVITHYTTIHGHKTSSVLIFIYREFRSSVYNQDVGAAAMYSLSHFLSNPITLRVIENSKIFHFDGFFIPHSPDVALYVLDKCLHRSVITSFNIGGKHVISPNLHITHFIKTCNIVTSNLAEFIHLCHFLYVPIDNLIEAVFAVYNIMLEEFKPIKYELKNMEKYKKILIITNGEKDILCVTSCDGLIKYKVPVVEQNKIRDTIGAGDSFLAGFFFGIVHELPILKCLEIGCRTAAEIMQQDGCTIPDKKSDSIVDI